ncbi:hypothetical protein SAMN05216232_3666 [Virgibacillus subterraneus]|uniref:Uncharacterized protein n=2 Tax=Virgibacillus TaxID=84406 RepID=A0A1H1DMP3_9BACI|nr:MULTISPECIES: hypothetical protein [Virgibacillus]SDQ77742.1 hypothetical protein SAMN05216231_2489 [Virgibacillus salinus]SEQ90978.1 hypothetical protein SAMN05216232_3666 [Virgibacillus subterraneus]
MVPVILTIILLIGLVCSIYIVVQKRKKSGITGMKSALTSICLYLVAITNILAYWYNFIGVLSWSIGVFLLLLGAYFTKYLPMPEKRF